MCSKKNKVSKRRPRPRLDPWRTMAPVMAFSIVFLIAVSLMILTWPTREHLIAVEVELARNEVYDELEEMESEPQAEPPPPESAIEIQPSELASEIADLPALAELPAFAPAVITTEAPTLPRPETVARITSPVTMQSVAGAARGAAGRIKALKRFGGNGAAEATVLRALRWLKTQQQPDGRWRAKGEGDATAFALLAFLSHGESLTSPEFGATVKAALDYLLDHHQNNMAAYALAEAAAIIRTPVLSEQVEAILTEFCQRQRQKIKANGGGMLHRYSAVMAVTSARLARLKVPGLENVAQSYADAFLEMRNAKLPDFTKIKGLGTWHYMIAGVCLQYLHHGNEPETVRMMKRLNEIWPPATLGPTAIACCPVRSNYFSTMIFFNAGGTWWEQWNRGMLDAYVDSQIVEGELGYWRCQDQHIGDQPFWPTCYIAHQLMVYYRYLPTCSDEAWTAAPTPPPRDDSPSVEVEVDL